MLGLLGVYDHVRQTREFMHGATPQSKHGADTGVKE
jgi:hypothetical protein